VIGVTKFAEARDRNIGDNHVSDQAIGGDPHSSRTFWFTGERGAPKGQGLHRPQNGCDSAGSLPHRMLIGLEDDKSSALRPGRFL
jgi:hypothetical protein